MSPAGLQSSFVLALGAVLLLWVGVVMYVVMTRAIYDAWHAAVRAVHHLLERGLEAAVEGDPQTLVKALDRLPRATIERVAADTGTRPAVAQVFAERALQDDGPRLIANAARHRSERSRWRRIAALRIIARAGWATAVPLLERALEDPDEDVVAAAVGVLGTVARPEAGRLLVQTLRSGTIERSRVAAQIDDFALDLDEPLLELCDDHDPDIRRWAARLLGRYAQRSDLALALAGLTGDPSPGVRAAAAQALAHSEHPAALAAALGLLADDTWYVRAHAARTVAALKGGEYAALVAQLLSDPQWWVRSAAKQALESFGAEAMPALVGVLGGHDEFARNSAAEVIQNTGVLDELLGRAARTPDDLATARLLRQVLAAGGPRLVQASLHRATEDDRPEAARVLRRIAARGG